MEYFDMRKMSVNLWGMLPVKRAKFALSHRQNVDFYWRASIASIAANGEFLCFPAWKG